MLSGSLWKWGFILNRKWEWHGYFLEKRWKQFYTDSLSLSLSSVSYLLSPLFPNGLFVEVIFLIYCHSVVTFINSLVAKELFIPVIIVSSLLIIVIVARRISYTVISYTNNFILNNYFLLKIYIKKVISINVFFLRRHESWINSSYEPVLFNQSKTCYLRNPCSLNSERAAV